MLNELDLHVTNRCTASCKYCCFSSNRNDLPELSFNEIKLLMRDAVNLGCRHVHLTGGEPLLRDDIEEILSAALGLGLEIRLQTNGLLLDGSCAERLRNLGLHSIMISLDSDRPYEHDAMRGLGTWSSAVEAILAARDAGLTVRVNSVITTVNWHRIHQTARFVRQLGIKTFSAFYFSPIGCGSDMRDVWIAPMEYWAYWRELTNNLQHDPDLDDMDIVIEKGYASWQEAMKIDVSDFSGCGGGCLHTYGKRDYLIVRCDGNVYPCIMGIDGAPLGNIRCQPLGEIYYSSPQWDSLKPTKDPYCTDCKYYALCNEGCRYYPNTISSHDGRCIYGVLIPLCPIMKYNTKTDCFGGSSDDVMLGRE